MELVLQLCISKMPRKITKCVFIDEFLAGLRQSSNVTKLCNIKANDSLLGSLVCQQTPDHAITILMRLEYFSLRDDADMHSAYLLRRRGWVAGCPTHAGIVSKRLKISKHIFDLLVTPSF